MIKFGWFKLFEKLFCFMSVDTVSRRKPNEEEAYMSVQNILKVKQGRAAYTAVR